MATVQHEVRILAGDSNDIDDVVEIMDQAFGTMFGEAWTRSQLAGILPMGGVRLMLARDDERDRSVGFSLFRSVADESELLLLAVHPDHHRRGIGQRLLEEFVQRARNDGIAKVHLEVRDGNPALEMYRKAGFSPVGRRRNYYQGADGQRHDAITLAHKP